MYYEEKLINGVLMCRTTPDGDWVEKMSKQTPPLFNTPEPAFVLRVQDAMCNYVRDNALCRNIACENCILDADLPEFATWLINQLKKSGE